jgi:hypothetical protein
MRGSSLRTWVFVALAVGVGIPTDRGGWVVPAAAAADPKKSDLPPQGPDLIGDEPLTIVFRRSVPNGQFMGHWNWSINSAGEAELTGYGRPRKVTLSADQMAAIRRSLRAERFTSLKESYGPFDVEGGEDALTVSAGGDIDKTVRFQSVWHWAGDPPTLRKVAPAARVWVTVVEILDPDEKMFRERGTLAKALQILKK